MISFELLYAIMANDCNSAVKVVERTTIVQMCPAPELKQPAVPAWWRPGITHEPQSVKIEKPKVVAKKKATKKKRKKRRR